MSDGNPVHQSQHDPGVVVNDSLKLQENVATVIQRAAGGWGWGQPAPNFRAGWAWPPQLLHVGTSGIGDGLPYKVFHNGCYKVNQNFAIRS